MITKYFKCKLLTDVVLNASLATEGNMQSLDFIPGSNFLGILAKELYKKANSETLDIFHSEKVKFGDALISKNEKISYALPFSLFQEKGKQNICDNKVYIHHGINHKVEENGRTLQLKQNRSGYLNNEGKYIKKVKKNFALKSAYDAEQRRSKESAMFGFDAIKAGQEFIFPVSFEDETYYEQLKNALEGTKQLGKSKTAQYGQVCIKELETEPEIFLSKPTENNQIVIYAESRLCFLNKYGNPTFQPKPSDFGIEGENLDFSWDKCQVRTGSYSLWNAKRNTPDSQRSFIERGSVFVIETKQSQSIDNLPKIIGEYQNEGFGRVIYNPEFLKYDNDGKWSFEWKKEPPKKDNLTKEPETIDEKIDFIEKRIYQLKDLTQNTLIGDMARIKAIAENKDLLIGLNILKAFDTEDSDILLDGKEYKDKDGKKVKRYFITKSQWGNIRKIAAKAESIDAINKELFGKVKADKISSFYTEKNEDLNKFIDKILTAAEKDQKDGYLMHGVADEKIWGKRKGVRRKALSRIIEQNRELGTQFVAKFAAEIAKKQDSNG